MRPRSFIPLSLLLFACAGLADGPQVVGWVEYARIYPGKMLFFAKLDTGAYSSHINARNVQPFEKDGEPWVRFNIVNRANRSMPLELPLAREVTVKLEEGEREQRPSVWLGICVAGVYKKALVSLDDRDDFLYPLLIGRKYLKGRFAVDPSLKFQTKPNCEVGDDG